ncbi:MAG: 3'-5' exonuclease [Caldilineaceae bacterium]|nr:3'-5' exonuclease [Caldilineaceae bacterium]
MDYASARREAIARAQQYLAQEPVYLDTETTGVRSSAEIIEISVVDHSGTLLYDALVRPRHPIPVDATRIHKITNAMVVDAPTWDAVWPQLETILGGRPIGIFNADFDLRLLRQSHHHAGLVWPDLPLDAFCIMNLYAQFYGEWDNYRQSWRWQSLDKAQRFCKIPLRNTHRAKDDALLARAVLQHIASAT